MKMEFRQQVGAAILVLVSLLYYKYEGNGNSGVDTSPDTYQPFSRVKLGQRYVDADCREVFLTR